MATYEVHAKRDGKYWHVNVPAVERVTQARHEGEIEEMARDLIAIMEDVEPDSFEVDIHVR